MICLLHCPYCTSPMQEDWIEHYCPSCNIEVSFEYIQERRPYTPAARTSQGTSVIDLELGSKQLRDHYRDAWIKSMNEPNVWETFFAGDHFKKDGDKRTITFRRVKQVDE